MFITVAQIQSAVAKSFGTPLEKMTQPLNRGAGKDGRNATRFSFPRRVAIYLAKKHTEHSRVRIGQLFGGRNHATIIDAIRTVEQRLSVDEVLRQRIENIEQSLEAGDKSVLLICEPPVTESLDCSMAQEAPKTKTEWRKKLYEERRSVSPVHRALMRQNALDPKVRDEDRVYRDPCIKCGTRGDIGCVHTRVAA